MRGSFSKLLPFQSVRWMPCHEFLCPQTRVILRLKGKSNGVRGVFKKKWSMLQRWLSLDALFGAIFLFLLSRSLLVEMRFIPSSSMYPTLQVEDRVVIEKVSYWYKSPAIGDIITFTAPRSLQEMGFKEDIFIKRIVAKAGDWVEVNNGVLYINGAAQSEDFIAEPLAYKMHATVCSLEPSFLDHCLPLVGFRNFFYPADKSTCSNNIME
ncbi:probable thylakoidal processing peptidase 2, chloroplastic isoform X2 [Amborella trichopoda]|uniref:probable thylakoidal processing peptidase 2, chloroplastic isoform X2 n=1 Tax=Amborella trichopoda TaxID=13333 RepID=UPI0009BE6AC1|nr:probable thylakoidal processing peptidase 2, chloroplastic isoform X2 [Amborella trichopoda]|eukprot:XP_020524430.1 probable thylakoidal processing peptidase 2, chloroplastic isoform X2 [Amborella trichopoda]